MMNIRDYIDTTVPLYQPQRHRHNECSDSKDPCLIITRYPTGFKFYCHRCGYKGIVGFDGLSIRQVVGLVRSRAEHVKRLECAKNISLPSDFTQEIPPQGLAWLYKFGVTDEDIRTYGIGYSKRVSRVILPVYQDGKLVYWQGRYLGDAKADGQSKYNNVKVERDSIYFRTDVPHGGTVVLVEDILSALKVGKVADAIGLLYAYVPDNLVFNLSKEYQTIIIWLDADKRERSLKYLRRFRSFGINVKRIYTPKDPKYYSVEEVKELIDDHT